MLLFVRGVEHYTDYFKFHSSLGRFCMELQIIFMDAFTAVQGPLLK